ncbi:MAG: hypothetical protein ACREMB_19555, partial [Candidatus Rokuibacteriota bacterium]
MGSTVVPCFLGERDYVWLRCLLEERERFVGQPERKLNARLREPLPSEGPPGKRHLAVRVLRRLGPSTRDAVVAPRQARSLVFGDSARTVSPRTLVLGRVADALGVT